MEMEKCFICDELFQENDDVSALTERGVTGIKKTCKERKISAFHVCVGQKVHKKCRARFVNLKTPFQEKESYPTTSRVLRSCESKFDFKEKCFFCGIEISVYFRERKKNAWFYARTVEFKSSVLRKCNERSDEWADKVKRRIENLSDLHAVDACYHKQCSVNFHTGKLIPVQFTDTSSTTSSSGRPEDSVRQEIFLQVAKYMEENDEEQTTVKELVERMRELLPENSEPYCPQYMKRKLKEHFEDNIFIGTIAGTADVVTFKSTATYVLREYHSQSHEDVEEDRKNIIMAAAEIIRNDIKDIPVDPEVYPPIENMSSVDYNVSYIPDSLRMLLSVLVTCKTHKERKVASIGQAVMQAVRPRVLVAPLQIGLAVQLHDNTSSRFVVEAVNHMGFCSSYSEVIRFEHSAAIERGTTIPVPLEPSESPHKFVQYAADNIDHNIITIDGHGTFHGMGIIAAVTPAGKFSTVIKKRQVSLEELRRLGQIPIKTYYSQASGMRSLTYNTIKDIAYSDPSANLDILLNISHFLSNTAPGWQGVCQLLHKGNHPGVSSAIFLPMINMDPTNETCILSTLSFVSDHAKRYSQTPIITFDQPLFHKALVIIANEPLDSPLRKVILRLGGLHTIMSFLGCIGFLMSGAGLADILQIIYAGNAVKHMLSGKAIARAIRGHLIVLSVLNTILATKALVDDQDDVHAARSLFNSLLNDELSVADITNEVVVEISTKLLKAKEELKAYRTPRLWLQYLEMVNILKQFLKAERTGNWHLHLAMVKEMLPFFAACGHNSYASSARLYYERMVELEFEAPDVYTAFTSGLHIVRRSDKFWGGLSTDLVIEQVLMKNIKGFGGMTHGKGMTEQQQLVWVMSRPICAHLNDCMQEFASVKHASSEQHVTMTSARIARDTGDTEKVIAYVEQLNVFERGSNLRNIVTGVTYGTDVNPELAEEIGKRILDDMTGKTVSDFSFRKSKQVKPMQAVKSVNLKGETFVIEPELLFQRLLLCAQTGGVDLHEVFRYELCSYPASLFDKHGFMRESGKSQLAKYIKEQVPGVANLPENLQFVVDGGWLLHRLPWRQKETFDELLCAYVRYVLKKYGQATIVFDGYEDTFSTKSEAHLKRNRGIVGPKVDFTTSTSIVIKKELFLSNKENKQAFIAQLSEKLHEAGCKTKQSHSDADVLIVMEAIELAKNNPTAIVGEDTDLLILLLHHFQENLCDIFLRPEPKKSSKTINVYDIRKFVNALGSDVCSHILFAHAILGCDTTSKPFGLGKSDSLKLLRKSDNFKESAAIFQTSEKSTEEISNAGLNAIISLYGGKTGDSTLHDMRLRTFTSKATKSTIHVKPEVLPPTEDASKFHSFRVYHQVQQWMGNAMDPLQWGFKVKDGRLTPIRMSQAPAPSHLLKFVKCGCIKGQCATLQCICKRQGILCTDACTVCRGISCCNSMEVDMDDD